MSSINKLEKYIPVRKQLGATRGVKLSRKPFGGNAKPQNRNSLPTAA